MFENQRGISVERYSLERKEQWDRFINSAKNATFLFCRDYMDYHRDRFNDHSLLISRADQLVAVLPANLTDENTLVSHQGLTFGGLVLRPDATLSDVLESFQATLAFLHGQQISKLIYKRVPRFYSLLPDDEVDYALFLAGARLTRRDCALTVPQAGRLPFQKRRDREIAKATRLGLRIVQENDFEPFWNRVLVPRLANRYKVKPVHTLEEISLLASRFPDCIKQFSVYSGDNIMGGTTVYETPFVAHAQYIAVSEEGQKSGALDLLFGWLITEQYRDKRYFDFGICNEENGRALNHGLAAWKESFGGRTCVHDFYEILTVNHSKLDSVLPARAVLAPVPQ